MAPWRAHAAAAPATSTWRASQGGVSRSFRGLSWMRTDPTARGLVRRVPRLSAARLSTMAVAAFAALLAGPAVAAAAGALVVEKKASANQAAAAGRWSLVIALGSLVVVLPLLAWVIRWAGWTLTGQRRGAQQPRLFWGRSLVVGQDNRVSTSKTTALVWTYTVAAAIASFIIARWLGHPGGFNAFLRQGLDAKYALLFGGPLAAAILAKGIVSAQIDSGQTAKPPAENPSLGQLAQDDTGQADLGDLQYLLFNLVALLFFYGEFLRAPQSGMPTMPDVLVGLTSVAAAGYVGKKSLSGPPVISDVRPPSQVVGEPVTLVTSGIVQPGDDLSVLTVAFGGAAGRITEPMTTTTTQGVLLDAPVPKNAAGIVNISVSVPNGKSAQWPGFKVKPQVIADRSTLTAPLGGRARVVTSGVSGLGPRLAGLAVTIDSRAAGAELDAADPTNNTLVVTVPAAITIPAEAAQTVTSLVVTSPGGSSDSIPFTVTR
jgi:hypothetical protein